MITRYSLKDLNRIAAQTKNQNMMTLGVHAPTCPSAAKGDTARYKWDKGFDVKVHHHGITLMVSGVCDGCSLRVDRGILL